ncbi:hypothetical protein GCM10023093_18400 [Nemorincola caseinilytica]|uniref:Glycosyltransferase 2-like domain-containing protein n=1 Tax=Nemorincola caseinilytica TaxID=2054315 RepID=A0ABP8NDX5_9BACT
MPSQDGNIAISVVIPVYNGRNTIGRALDSVLAQSLPAHEVIVVDDASTDDTVSYLRALYGDRIKLIESRVNSGSSVARNTGLDAATGTHIALLDADDAWHKDKLAIAARILSQDRKIALLYHDHTLRDIMHDAITKSPQVHGVSFVGLVLRNTISTSCVVLRNGAGFRFERTMRHTEDHDLWLRICYRHKAAYIPYELTRLFRGVTTKGGVSGDRWAMRKGELRAYARLVRLNILFAPVVPLLWGYSLLKHVAKLAGIRK